MIAPFSAPLHGQPRPFRLLIVENDPATRRAAAAALREGWQVKTASNLDKALRKLAGTPCDLVLLDLAAGRKEEGLAPLANLAALKRSFPLLPVVALVPEGDAILSDEARRLGAQDCVATPLPAERLRAVLHEATASLALRRRAESAELEAEAGKAWPISDEAEMRRTIDLASRAAPTACTVLLLGEGGTGKSLFARALHAHSHRREQPFVTVNCSSLTPDLLDEELFGRGPGSFPESAAESRGAVAAAEGGTLFLDEIGDLPAEVQPKLLRLLQEREYERIGEPLPRPANIRVLAATGHDLAEAVQAGKLRVDLYYRLNVVALTLPPLRRRQGDILRLAERFLRSFANGMGKSVHGWTPEAAEMLVRYDWPGNLRELRNVVERAAILCDRERIEPRHLPDFLRAAPAVPRVGALISLEKLELEHIRHVIARSRSYEQAAEILGIDPNTLHRKRKKLEEDERAALEDTLRS